MGKSLDRDDRAIKKIDLWDWIVALYILAIYVFENAQYSMLFSLIQLSFLPTQVYSL